MSLVADYIVKAADRPGGASIYINGKEVAEMRTRHDLSHVLATKDGNEWALTARVNGDIIPFSMTVKRLKARDAHDAALGTIVLTVRYHVFLHKGKFYMFGAAPEGRPLREFLVGKKFICRLDNFPFSDLTEIDLETMERLRRFRGVPVGEYEGLGKEGHRVRISEELEDIGLPLAASCYLLYSTA
ncbi:MAG: hypothetical protein OK455_02040 [Thaumarchaeota archaeon]|nr:hypothetical protein [Nitrososphaerota archaeon]